MTSQANNLLACLLGAAYDIGSNTWEAILQDNGEHSTDEDDFDPIRHTIGLYSPLVDQQAQPALYNQMM